MNVGKLTLGDLGRLVLDERQRRGLSLREAAEEIGIPFNTLARVEKGHLPDLPKFKRLVEWCAADINQFFEAGERATSTTDIIAAHLRADGNLTSEAADRIAGIVKELYQALAQPQEVVAVHLRAAKTFRADGARALGELLSDLNQALVEESVSGTSERV